MIYRRSRFALSETRPKPARGRAFRALLIALTLLDAAQPAAMAADPPAEPAASQGPVLSSYEIVQGAILLRFAHEEGSLVLKSPGRGVFEIAGSDHVWFPAEAHLVNGAVVVSTSLLQKPTAARYRWATVAVAALFSRDGQPVAAFSTEK